MARLYFFIGKGGVGKTTISAAYALRSAIRHARESVLLLSTDPAHSLVDVLGQSLGDRPAKMRLPRRGTLHAWQVNAEREFRGFLAKHKEEVLSLLESGSIFSRQDLEPLLDTTLPGMAEMSALLAIDEALSSGKFDRVIVDTAPFGHTLRLFEMPEHFSRFLDLLELAASRDQVLAAHFGGTPRAVKNQLVSEWRVMVEGLRQAFAKGAQLFLVTTPEKFSLNESLRASMALRKQSPPLGFHAVVLNRAVSRAGQCGICQSKHEATRGAQSLLRRTFPRADFYLAEDTGVPIAGAAGLLPFAEHVFARRPLRWKVPSPASPEIRLKPAKWPVLDRPLSLVLGKGGVGKTTISAALGFRTRASARRPVEICSVDPAPSLDDVFQSDLSDQPRPVLGDSKFRASELDAVALFHDWAAQVKNMIEQSTTSEMAGLHVDLWFERELFSKLLDSVPPGLDEILAVIRIQDLVGHREKRVVIDMAPTGHALDLLRTPGRILVWTRLLLKTLAAHRTLAIARDAGVEVAKVGKRVRELLEILKDPKDSSIYTVMLAEPLPDRETERLINQLRQLELPADTIFVNRVLFPEDIRGCTRCQRARQWQLKTLQGLRRRYSDGALYVARNFPAEIAGKKALRAFTGELWRLV